MDIFYKKPRAHRPGFVPWRAAALAEIQNEVEAGDLAAARAAQGHDEFGIKNRVSLVAGLFGKIELRRESRPIRGLNSYVKVARASRVESRHDGLKAVLPGRVGKLVATKPKAGVVVRAVSVGLPKINQSPLNRLAFRRTDIAFKNNSRPLNARIK